MGGAVHHSTAGWSRQREACGERWGEEGSTTEGEKKILDSLASYLQSHLDLTYCKCNVMFCFSIVKVKMLITQLCPTLCGPKGSSPPGSSLHGIVQARILEWVAIPFSGVSSQPRDGTLVSCIASRFFIV